MPGDVLPGKYSFEAGTAGSVSLVFQTVLAPLALAGATSSIVLKGGTHVPWSPPTDYISDIFLPALYSMGVHAGFFTSSRGYYPAGGGVVESAINPSSLPLKPFAVQTRGDLLSIRLVSAVSRLPLSIAERQLRSASTLLSDFAGFIEPELIEAASAGTGTSVFILAEFENMKAGFSALGARGKRAEEVGAEAARLFLDFMKTGSAVDPYLSDQLLTYMALAKGESAFTTSEITRHLLTNIHTIETFIPVKFTASGQVGEPGAVSVRGAGFERRISG